MNKDVKPVVGFENFYLVSRQGEVIALRNKNGKKTLKPYKDKDGYLRVRLYGDKKKLWIGIHKIVAMAFLENPRNCEMINHKNFKRDDNRVENLEWCNSLENVKYSIKHYKGAKHRAVVGIDQEGNKTLFKSVSEASRNTKVNVSNICRCCKGRTNRAGGYIWKYAD